MTDQCFQTLHWWHCRKQIFSSSDLAFLISLTTSRALTFSPLFFRTHSSEEGRSCRSAHSLSGTQSKSLYFDTQCISTLYPSLTLMDSCASNSGKSAVGPAVHRLTLSSRPPSTGCFPSAFNTSFTSLGEYICLVLPNQPALDDFLQHASSCSLPISFVHARVPVHFDRLSQPCASDTSDLAPNVSPQR